MLRKARRRAKSTGKDVDDILLDFIYADEVRIADRVACIKLWKEFTMAKLAEGGDADRSLGPQIFLPAHRPPLQVVDGGKGA